MENNRKNTMSTARNSYRRRTKTSRNYKGKLKEPVTKADILIMQCLVCGIVLVFALAIRLIDTPFTNTAQDNLKGAIGENITAQDFEENTAGFSQTFNSAKNTVLSFFGYVDESEIQPLNNNETVNVFSNQSSEMDFRIDEDILNSLYEEMDYTIKKQEVPED